MKILQSLARYAVMPFILVASIVLFILDNLHVNINPIMSYEPKNP